MRKSFMIGVALLALAAPAMAQVNIVPQVGDINRILKRSSYAAVARGLAPAASATDIACISGSASKAISIKRIEITGTAGTLVTVPTTLVRRSTLDSGGTAATGAALPVATPLNLNDPAATATLTAYTANPTINDSSPRYMRSAWTTLPTVAAATSISQTFWDASTSMDILMKGLDIPAGSTTVQYCINLNGVSVSSGLLDINFYWTEE